LQNLISLVLLVALSNISNGEELFAIPRNVVLSVNNSRFKNLISQSLEDLGPWLSLIVVMIYEYLLSEDSAWSAYFQVLPTSFDTLMFWSKSELSELQASAIVNRIGKQDAEDSVLELVAPIVRSNPTLFPPLEGLSSYEGTDGNNALLDLAHRMGSLIMAYAFDIEDDTHDGGDEDGYVTDDEQLPKGMVPLADLLNADADRNNVSLIPSYLHPTCC
jgi:N-lysine methyltransferase SETD6